MQRAKSRILLAPMEGVVDARMRDMLTRIGGFDRCVTEFVRVVDRLYPRHVFTRYCPELLQNSQTVAGVPVYLQLLGSHHEAMAGNARKAAKLGAAGVDINFGCPSKVVNQRDGGSAVLREPARVAGIINAVRQAVPADTPVTAKIRLGYDDDGRFREIIDAIGSTAVTELCVHARTKIQGYKPPAYWSQVGYAVDKLAIPVVINGEIWNAEQALQARRESGCTDVMIGRGAIACPDLALQIRAAFDGVAYQPLPWPMVAKEVREQALAEHADQPKYAASRTKQWLVYLKGHYPEAVTLFEQIKRAKTIPEMIALWDAVMA